MIWAAIWWYSVGPIITFHSRIAARKYVNRLGNSVHPTVQTLFPNNYAVFQEDIAPIHTAGSVQSRSEEHEVEVQHLTWPAKSPDLNVIEPPWSVLETRVRGRFPPSKSVKQLEDVLQEKWFKIPLKTVRNLYESIPRRIAAVLRAKMVQHHTNKEICSVSITLSNLCT
jgi:hypothetical protein